MKLRNSWQGWFMSKTISLKKVAKYSEARIPIKDVTINNFVTTDSLLQNKLGITKATSLPPQDGNMTAYFKNNILVGNIRPYLKKIWFADRDGGNSADVLTIQVDTKHNPKFIYYALYRDDFFEHMMKGSKGTKMPRGDKTQIMDFTIPNIDRIKEDKIANILSSFDSKIELNNKINKELEAMAKTLYDYWFVQFDFPDENGKPYKSSGGKMVYNQELKREIPEGWDVKDLEEICEIYQPQTISEKEMIKDGKYFVFGANGIVGMYDKYNHEDSEVTITCRGNSCGTLNRTLPYSWITGNAMVVRFKDDKIHNEYLMQLLSWTKMDNVITGSAQPQITRTNLAPLKILIPKNNILDNFSQKMEFNINLQLKNIEQNQELAKLRDWLLPMLMNGQVKVEI